MKIIADENILYVKEAFAQFGQVVLMPGRKISAASIADADILLVRSVTQVNEALVSGSSLRFIASATIGIEHVDVPYLAAHNVGFACATGSNANSVAEYIVGAMIHCAKKQGRSLSGLVLGIVGHGNIGSIVDRYARALGMRCLLNDPPKQRLTGNNNYRTLDEVLAGSDIVTLHVPLTSDGGEPTKGMVDRDFLEKMKPGAILINACRGRVMNEKDLKEYRSKLGGLVLDVWYHEPAVDTETCAMADIATPHIAGYSYDGKVTGTSMIYTAACAFFERPCFWDPAPVLSDTLLLDLTTSSDPIADAVFSVLPTMRDDRALRQVVTGAPEKLEVGFDALRSNYAKRLEFSHYTVRVGRDQAQAKMQLEKLGFKTT